MKKTPFIANTLFAILCAVFINTKSFAEPKNLDTSKAEVQQYYKSGAYEKELTTIATEADHYITQQALANQHQKAMKKLAIILDIDETSLSNYNNMLARDFANDPKKIQQELRQANEPAIKPILALYKNALKHHVAVFFITGRRITQEPETIKNLKFAGYTTWTGLYMRPQKDHQASAVSFKAATRANISKQGYTIIASIGDQMSDSVGGYTQKSFKLPNPFYYIA